MAASFERRPIEDSTWEPEVCGVSFKDRLASKLGEAAEGGAEVWCVFVTVGEDDGGLSYTEQITPENCQVMLSDLDDDSDSVLVLDRRDDMWFRYNRLNHPDTFDTIVRTVAPWALRLTGLMPMPRSYQAVLDQLEGDVESVDELFIPDDWATPPTES